MPNFGSSETGLLQPLLSVLEELMEMEEVSHTDSPPPPAPVPAPSSQQDATPPPEVCSASVSGPGPKPVEFKLAAGEEQGILHGDHPNRRRRRELPNTGPALGLGRPPVLGIRSDQS